MTRWRIVASAALGMMAASSGIAAAALPPLGVWSNPRGTLAVRTAPCDNGLCGTIVWADGRAMADARAAGVGRLVGTQLLRDYRPAGNGTWSGRLFAPDMKRSFPSRLTLVAPDRLRISSCFVRHYFCRSQEWHRLR
ncbi:MULTISPECIES: DUF2147 domain-containing protein [unclassified Sphingomonas]|uniref:DUF2147 domain-containing protein n=1 Tax=unclassified Sphingomonas TaxID=196159 RepID=UPI00092790BE|nr:MULTISPECIES: DUF2147 domain-containing protein [unclassified Sphingomonas]OJV32929.1 MAG: hypothetical protein BGO24_07485 [Sphingomonas sp. 67-36]